MQDLTDGELLEQYADRNSDEAFSVLVARHVNLVYSTALRKAGNPNAAEEITQAVFIILAKKAGTFRKSAFLSGWLYQTTRLAAQNFLRSEIRRSHREQEAYMQSLSNETDLNVWEQVAPHLEDAMGRLSEKDRNAIALRFFEGKSFQEVGSAFGTSENAAKKRVAYALEKLRKFFVRRGVVSSTAIIATVISANSVQAAPTTLATSVSAIAITKGVTASGSTLALVKGASKLMAWLKIKTAALTGAAILLATGTSVLLVKEFASKEKLRTKPATQIASSEPDDITNASPALMVRTTRFPNKLGHARWSFWGERSETSPVEAIGLNTSFESLIGAAYCFGTTRTIFPPELPHTNFDFLATLPNLPAKKLQAEVEKVTGFVAHPEMRETDVLLLKVKNTNAPGLRPGTVGRSGGVNGGYYYRETNQPISSFRAYLESNILKKPVIDETGLTNQYDLNLEWGPMEWGGINDRRLEQAMIEQLGLELVPARQRIEMLVVELAKGSDKAALYKEVSPSSIDEATWDSPRLEFLPPVLILRPTRFREGSVASRTDDSRVRMIFKNSSLDYILAAAANFKVNGNFCTWRSRIMAPANLPQERFDLLLTVPDAEERLRKEIKKQLGLEVRRETREVEALIIKESETVAPKPSVQKQTPASTSETRMEKLPLWIIAQNIEAYLGKPVLVQTTLTNNFTLTLRTVFKDQRLTFDEKELKRDFVNQLGLELVAKKEPVEMLIVEHTNK